MEKPSLRASCGRGALSSRTKRCPWALRWILVDLTRKLTLFGGATAILFAVAFAIPVPQYCIELQPDGKTSLGCFPGQDVRLVGIAFGMIPLALSAAMIFAPGSRRAKVNTPVYVGIALTVGFLMLALLLRTFRN